MVLTADTGQHLGALLISLIEWIMEPPFIDLTDSADGVVTTRTFKPPANTAIGPTGDQITPNILVLVAENTTYSMYVHLIPSSTRIVVFRCTFPKW